MEAARAAVGDAVGAGSVSNDGDRAKRWYLRGCCREIVDGGFWSWRRRERDLGVERRIVAASMGGCRVVKLLCGLVGVNCDSAAGCCR